jgi:hypothetical protein
LLSDQRVSSADEKAVMMMVVFINQRREFIMMRREFFMAMREFQMLLREFLMVIREL